MTSFTVGDTVSLYEQNYKLLVRLLPDIQDLKHSLAVNDKNGYTMRIDVLERCRYTTVIAISYRLNATKDWISDPYMKVRVCHDARVAEAIASQDFGRFEARYTYPNSKMFGPYEKRQINRFLGEWLRYCLASGHEFVDESKLTSV